MKTAIYIEDGVTQLVLTPENDWEKNAIGSYYNQRLDAQVFEGQFYDCRGGWTRQREHFPEMRYMSDAARDVSLILRVAKQPPPPEPRQAP